MKVVLFVALLLVSGPFLALANETVESSLTPVVNSEVDSSDEVASPESEDALTVDPLEEEGLEGVGELELAGDDEGGDDEGDEEGSDGDTSDPAADDMPADVETSDGPVEDPAADDMPADVEESEDEKESRHNSEANSIVKLLEKIRRRIFSEMKQATARIGSARSVAARKQQLAKIAYEKAASAYLRDKQRFNEAQKLKERRHAEWNAAKRYTTVAEQNAKTEANKVHANSLRELKMIKQVECMLANLSGQSSLKKLCSAHYSSGLGVCTHMSNPSHGSLSCNGNTKGKRCTVKCGAGYRPVQGTLTCGSHGLWNGTPKCQVAVTCTTVNKRKTGSGAISVSLPSGYTTTGGGSVNHYRAHNARAGFEAMFPSGSRAYACDMGFGWGDYTCQVRGCKFPSGTSCVTRSARNDRAGVTYADCPSGYTLTGGGVNNRYRSYNKLGVYEESMPSGNRWRCDTGLGSGKLDCYARCCKFPSSLKTSCVTRSSRKRGSGIRTVTCPSGYVVTGGGMNNHYRGFNQKSIYEESYAVDQRTWRCDSGNGWGDFTCYARCCRFL